MERCPELADMLDLSFLYNAPPEAELLKKEVLIVPVQKTPADTWRRIEYPERKELAKAIGLGDSVILETGLVGGITLDKPIHPGWFGVSSLLFVLEEDTPEEYVIKQELCPTHVSVLASGHEYGRRDWPANENIKGCFGPMAVVLTAVYEDDEENCYRELTVPFVLPAVTEEPPAKRAKK